MGTLSSFLNGFLTSFREGVLSSFFPEGCIACGKGGTALCSSCLKTISPHTPPLCPRCLLKLHHPLDPCPFCSDSPLEWVFSLGPYRSPLRDWIHQIKFHGKVTVLKILAERIVENVQEGLSPGILVPVPPGNKENFLRGENIPTQLARFLSELLSFPVLPLLIRRIPSQPQRKKNREERLKLFPDQMGVREELLNKSFPSTIYLVDDVLTTGATLKSAGLLLKSLFPSLSIKGIVLARVNPQDSG